MAAAPAEPAAAGAGTADELKKFKDLLDSGVITQEELDASCFQNCKIEFCRIILQFCRCGGLFDAKGNPDGFLSHFSSLRNFWLDNSLTV